MIQKFIGVLQRPKILFLELSFSLFHILFTFDSFSYPPTFINVFIIIVQIQKYKAMRTENYDYLSKSTVTSLNFKRSPYKYTNYQSDNDDNLILAKSMHTPARKQPNHYNYEFSNRNEDPVRQPRSAFDTRTNKRLQEIISKSTPPTKYQEMSPTIYNKSQYNFGSSNVSNFDLVSSAVYDRSSRKQENMEKYHTFKSDKFKTSQAENLQPAKQEKYKFYTDAVQKFKQQAEVTSKMSEEIRKLKEDRKRRLQAKQREAQLQKQLKEKLEREKEAFKKNSKPYYAYYSPKQQKTYNLDKYMTDYTSSLKTLNMQKYKSSEKDKNANYESPSKKLELQKKNSKYQQYLDSKDKLISLKTSDTPTKLKSISINLFNGETRDFYIGKQLGQGKFGTVFQAFHKTSKSLYALKKVPKQMISKHLMIDQFCLEVKLQMFLNHENILSLFHVFDDKTHIYLLLQYMQQGTLFTHLKKNKKLGAKQVAIKIKEIASAIHYLHQNQIAHRDIKPENIVMSHGVCKLCDFGWATICDQRRKTYCGTFDYAPPEILAGAEYDYTVDLWCLGVLTYQLLVGKAPFYHISRKETMKKILNVENTNLQYPQGIPKQAIEFIESLIKKNPKERLSSQQILQHPFLNTLGKKFQLQHKNTF